MKVILLILLCLVAPLFIAPRLFLFRIPHIFVGGKHPRIIIIQASNNLSYSHDPIQINDVIKHYTTRGFLKGVSIGVDSSE